MPDCALVLLAGGKAVRMNRLSHYCSKPATIVFDRPLLVRTLDFARNAGICRAYISTTSEHLDQLAAIVERYRTDPHAPKGDFDVEVRLNAFHKYGAIPAFLSALSWLDTELCALALADEFFSSNPFSTLFSCIADATAVLSLAPAFVPEELNLGGVVFCNGTRVTRIEERSSCFPAGAHRWTGAALLRTTVRDSLSKHVESLPADAPIGEVFSRLLASGFDIRTDFEIDFVNVNTNEDLLLANLYASLAALKQIEGLSDAVSEAISRLRVGLAARAIRGVP